VESNEKAVVYVGIPAPAGTASALGNSTAGGVSEAAAGSNPLIDCTLHQAVGRQPRAPAGTPPGSYAKAK